MKKRYYEKNGHASKEIKRLKNEERVMVNELRIRDEYTENRRCNAQNADFREVNCEIQMRK